jgi:hypothetical protein
VGVVAAVLAASLLLVDSHRSRIVGAGHPYVRTYSHATRGLSGAMAAGDGQAFGALAQDPTLARPGVFVAGRDVAYRFQRPLLGYLAWAVSLGQPQWEPGAQAAVVVLGAGLAVAAGGELLRRRRRNALLALAILLMPGMLSSISGLTSEPIALAFLTLGVVAWWAKPRHAGLAASCFVLATLGRESSLVAVAALMVIEMGGADRPVRGAVARRVGPLAIPFGAYLGWLLVLRARLGSWPWTGRQHEFSLVPLRELFRAMSRFADPTASWLWIVIGSVLIAGALARRERATLGSIVIAYGLFAAFFGTAVWERWQDFSRPLLPLYAYGVVIVLTRVSRAVSDEPQPAPSPVGLTP